MLGAKISECYEVDKVNKVGVKMHVFPTSEVDLELYWWASPEKTTVTMSQCRYKWFLHRPSPPHGTECDMRVTKDDSVEELVISQKRESGLWETAGYLSFDGWKRLQNIMTYTRKDVVYVGPYCYNNGFGKGTDDKRMLQQILIAMGSRRYHRMLSDGCKQCSIDNSFHLNYNANECRNCQFVSFDDHYIGHGTLCITKNVEKCKQLAREALLSVQLLELALVAFSNNLRNNYIYFTSQMQYNGVSMDELIGSDMDHLIEIIVRGGYCYPLSDSLIRKLAKSQDNNQKKCALCKT